MKDTKEFMPYVDIEDMKLRLQGSIEFYPELLNVYLKKDYINEIKKLFEEKNDEVLRVCVHTIKGALGNLSLKKAYEFAQTFELKIKENTHNKNDIEEFEKILFETKIQIEKLLKIMSESPALIS